MLKKDNDATIAAHFEDKKSYICLDGREILAGKDWIARKYVLWCEAKGKCEVKGCQNAMDDCHHLVRRSKRRDDRLENLMAICRYHHNLLDRRKPQWSKK